ncbi:MAG TPA: hypothetical protein VGR45_00690 [Stellaceae bacterium]|nr:hypothetical protein [Stellaceae bacterium]
MLSGLPGARGTRAPTIDRNKIYHALFEHLKNAAPFLTVGTRLKPWSQVSDQPAMFLRAGPANDWLPRPTKMPMRVVLEAEVWLYSSAGEDPDVSPSLSLNPLIDAIEAALDPFPLEALTLGGLVTHCWLEGNGALDSGDLTGQAVAMLPVKMLVPGVSPTGVPL